MFVIRVIDGAHDALERRALNFAPTVLIYDERITAEAGAGFGRMF